MLFIEYIGDCRSLLNERVGDDDNLHVLSFRKADILKASDDVDGFGWYGRKELFNLCWPSVPKRSRADDQKRPVTIKEGQNERVLHW